ncbi:MAG: hypothetical protein U0797_26805 [Gemmataceae bacterium]
MRQFFGLLSLAGAVAVLGCGPARSNVSGTVSYKGKALTAGTIILLAPDNRSHQADIGPDGKYQVAGVARGKVKVAVIVGGPAAAAAARPGQVEGPRRRQGGQGRRRRDGLAEGGGDEPARQPDPGPLRRRRQVGAGVRMKDPEQTYPPDLK